MKNSFKYSILLLLVSFLIAKLCCGSHKITETYNNYPFEGLDESVNNLSQLQDVIFKYNNIISDPRKTGSLEYNTDTEINNIQEELLKNQGRLNYKRLLDTQPIYGNYMPFESRILSNNFKVDEKPSLIKGEKIITDPSKKVDSLPAQYLDPQVQGGIGSTDKVKIRNNAGVDYHPPNACIGEWSDWNSDNCGSENNRCGIMFKKHTIYDREKNDENGPGEPCEYKDGIIKYKYCYGQNADDYESNMERCGIQTNLCPCKLNDKDSFVLNGENVYDLEDENCLFELEKNCICPKGYTHLNMNDICILTPGVDCSGEEEGCIYTPGSDVIEEKCEIPSFLSQKQETDFFEKYSSVNGKCKKKECDCPNGIKIDDSECLIDGLELCNIEEKCSVGYYMGGNPPVCKKQSEGEDVYKECSCLYGSPRIEENTNTRCNPENVDFVNSEKILQFCNNTSCESGYKISQGVNATALCNEYYSYEKYESINCCLPEYDTCLLEETELIEKKIRRKDKNDNFTILNEMLLGELKTNYENVSGETISSDVLLNEVNPKAFLIEKILLIDSGDDDGGESCSGDIDIGECYSVFQCSPGHGFLPSSEYSDENELRIVGCEKRGVLGLQNICQPLKNCLAANVETLTFEDGVFKADGEECLFPSNSEDKFQKAIIKNGLSGQIQGDTPYDADSCAGPQMNECGGTCFIKQIQTHYPMWNGTCVPVSCPISDTIKETYNISYDNCSSGSRNCGLTDVSCKKDEYEVSNTRKMLYCPSPQKVNSSYLTNEYEIINIGCSENPPDVPDIKSLRDKMMEEHGKLINRGETDDILNRRESPNANGLTQRVNFTGSTSERQLELEVGLEERRIQAEEEEEERVSGLASFGDSADR